MRSTNEWIGKTDDSRPPPSVRLRIFARHNGKCHISGRQIRPGEAWEAEHIIALCNGGENRESNMAPALVKPHKVKTAADRRQKSKADKKQMANLGIRKRRRTIPGRRFDGTAIPSRWVG